MSKDWQTSAEAAPINKPVIVAWDGTVQHRTYAKDFKGRWYLWGDGFGHNVYMDDFVPSHWMPLPEPPTEPRQ